MTNEQEQKLKAMAEEQQQQLQKANPYGQITNGALGKDFGYAVAVAPPLAQRIRTQLRRSETEAFRAEQLRELEHLLDKNPEVARILDLLEAVKV